MTNRRRHLCGALAVIVALGVSLAAMPAEADRNSINDKKRQREQVRQQRALISSQINTLQASDQQIEAALQVDQRQRRGNTGAARSRPARA